MSEIRSIVSKPTEPAVWNAEAAEAWYQKWPTFRCRPVKAGQKSCGKIVPGFPSMASSPCPECTQHAPDGHPVIIGILVKMSAAELEPELFAS